MGEVIEIVTLGKKVNLYKYIIKLFNNTWDDKSDIYSVKVMDTWKYDNLIEITSISDIENYIEKMKIVNIELKQQNGYAGISIEKKNDRYITDSWINPNKEISNKQYHLLIHLFAKQLTKIKEIEVCGIGKEVFLDFELGINKAISEAHNIDLWILNRDINKNNIIESINSELLFI